MSVTWHASQPAAPQVGDAYFDDATQEAKFYNGFKWLTFSHQIQVPAVPYEPPKPKLSVELVPESAWWSNVRSNISKKDWEKCKAFVRERSGGKCEICGGVGPKHPVECHEIWVYDYEYQTSHGTQVLVDLIALCPDCHRVKHIGRTAKVGGLAAMDRSIQHLCKVNGWIPEEAEKYLEEAFALHGVRSGMTWDLNIDYLAMLGIEPEVRDRP